VFKSWLINNSNGFYLNEGSRGNIKRGSGKMILHIVGCKHLGMGEGVISTTFAKAASSDIQQLFIWANDKGLEVRSCRSCKPD
jgi:hypothetical protein